MPKKKKERKRPMVVTVQVPQDLKAVLNAIAKDERRSLSQVVRNMVEDSPKIQERMGV